jgi:hypothetical protein
MKFFIVSSLFVLINVILVAHAVLRKLLVAPSIVKSIIMSTFYSNRADNMQQVTG